MIKLAIRWEISSDLLSLQYTFLSFYLSFHDYVWVLFLILNKEIWDCLCLSKAHNCFYYSFIGGRKGKLAIVIWFKSILLIIFLPFFDKLECKTKQELDCCQLIPYRNREFHIVSRQNCHEIEFRWRSNKSHIENYCKSMRRNQWCNHRSTSQGTSTWSIIWSHSI